MQLAAWHNFVNILYMLEVPTVLGKYLYILMAANMNLINYWTITDEQTNVLVFNKISEI